MSAFERFRCWYSPRMDILTYSFHSFQSISLYSVLLFDIGNSLRTCKIFPSNSAMKSALRPHLTPPVLLEAVFYLLRPLKNSQQIRTAAADDRSISCPSYTLICNYTQRSHVLQWQNVYALKWNDPPLWERFLPEKGIRKLINVKTSLRKVLCSGVDLLWSWWNCSENGRFSPLTHCFG